MKKHLLFTICCLLFTVYCNAQLLFYQDAYHGGITSDGRSYYNYDYMQADSFTLHTHIPSGASIRKAYLISFRLNTFLAGVPPLPEIPLQLKLNNHNFTLDSSDIATNIFYDGYSTYDLEVSDCIVAKDVTPFVNNNGNVLVVHCQGCLPSDSLPVYNGFLLMVMYEMPLYPAVNIALFLNTQTFTYNMVYNLNGLNSIINTNDVGLSINVIEPWDSTKFSLSSPSGTNYLGAIRAKNYYGTNDTNYHYAPGSFYYENNTLFGLRDDNPNNGFDTTDALVNIKNYIPNNCQTFTLNASVILSDKNYPSTFILAYSTPCPARSSNDSTQIYTICASSSVQLAVSNPANSTYSWYSAIGDVNSSITPSVVVTPTVSTNYIAYIDSAGCKHTEQFKVLVNTAPLVSSPTISPDSCNRSIASVTAGHVSNGNSPYVYNLNGITQNVSAFSNLSSGAYTLTITNNIGCSLSQLFSITNINKVNPIIIATPVTGQVPLNVNFGNNSTAANTYTWYINNAMESTNLNYNYTFTQPGIDTVMLVASYNNNPQCTDTAIQIIHANPELMDSFNITAPNIFTPNNDTKNDLWQPIVYNYQYTVNTFECTIYDRWGKKVFATNDINQTWSGKDETAGTYFYIINYKTTGNSQGIVKKETLKGFLELVR